MIEYRSTGVMIKVKIGDFHVAFFFCPYLTAAGCFKSDRAGFRIYKVGIELVGIMNVVSESTLCSEETCRPAPLA